MLGFYKDAVDHIDAGVYGRHRLSRRWRHRDADVYTESGVYKDASVYTDTGLNKDADVYTDVRVHKDAGIFAQMTPTSIQRRRV